MGNPAKALKLARKLVESKPDVLVANATPSLIAMREATATIPVVFVSVADPVGQGFVPSLSRPGGNITGFSVEEASMGGKWLEVLKQSAPRLTRIAIIYNPDTAPMRRCFFRRCKPPLQKWPSLYRYRRCELARGYRTGHRGGGPAESRAAA